MNRENAIKIIDSLYPADSSSIGEKLLKQAIKDTRASEHWSNHDDETLIRYAELCLLESKKYEPN